MYTFPPGSLSGKAVSKWRDGFIQGFARLEAEDIKKRWQEYTEDLYKKDLHDPDNHDGVITHLEPDILECDVQIMLNWSPITYEIINLFITQQPGTPTTWHLYRLATLLCFIIPFWHSSPHPKF